MNTISAANSGNEITMNKLTNFGARTALLIGLAAITPSCASTGGGAQDDSDPELIVASGNRAAVAVADGAFSYSGGGAAAGSLDVDDGQGNVRTIRWNYNVGGWTWNRGRASELEAYFIEALAETHAFRVISQSDAISEQRKDRQLNQEDLQSDAQGTQIIRPDLVLHCAVTRLEPNAGGTSSSARTHFWNRGVLGWFFGSGSKSTTRGEVEIKIRIVDRATGEVLTTATGQGYSTGSRTSGRVGGWQALTFGSGSTSTREEVNMSAAMQRATIRAVNDLIDKIPARYNTHPAWGE